MFDLHERLAADTAPVRSLGLSELRLMRNRLWPWLILVPRRAGITEIHQLLAEDRAMLMDEIVACSSLLERLFAPDKLNVGALGNVVPQLHVHVIGRRRDDPAWPGPVWGSGRAQDYPPDELAGVIARLNAALG